MKMEPIDVKKCIKERKTVISDRPKDTIMNDDMELIAPNTDLV